MKILNVMWSSGAAFASVHRAHRNIMFALGDEEFDTWFLQGAPHPSCEALGRLTVWRLSRKLLKGRQLWKLARPLVRQRLAKELDRLAPDCVLLDGIGTARMMLPLLASRPSIRALVIMHGFVALSAQDRHLLARCSAQQVSVVAVSATLARALQTQLAQWTGGIESCPTALFPPRFAAQLLDRAQARAQLGLPEQGRVLGGVGRLVEAKGFSTLLAAFARVAQSSPDWTLCLVGEGQAREVLVEQVAALGLSDRVRFAGHRDDAARLYRAFDWVAIPSRQEGQGLVLQEAVLADVALMLSDIGVFREQLGDAGLYARADDVEDWTMLLERCLPSSAEPYAAAQRAQLAPEQAWRRFCLDYRRLLGIKLQ